MEPGLVEWVEHSLVYTVLGGIVIFAAVHFFFKGRTEQWRNLFQRMAGEVNGKVDLSKSWPVLNFEHKGHRISLYYEVSRSGGAAQDYTRLSVDVPSGKMWFECYSRKGMVLPSKSHQFPTGDAEFDKAFVIWSHGHFDEHSGAFIKSLFSDSLRAAFTEFHHFTGTYSALRVEDGKMILTKKGKLTEFPLLRRYVETGLKVFDCLPVKQHANKIPQHAVEA